MNILLDKRKRDLIKDLHDFYIPYRDSLNLPNNVTFGCEIEFKMPGYDFDYQLNHATDDDEASEIFLKEKGYDYLWDVQNEVSDHLEVISPVLTDAVSTWQMLDNILFFLKNNDAYYSHECGAHVHVGRNLFNDKPEKWVDFFKFWTIFENDIIRFTNGEYFDIRKNAETSARKSADTFIRAINNYKKNGVIDVSATMSEKILDVCFPASYDSRINDYTLNLCESVDNNKEDKNNTIEFRSPNGTLNPIIWQNNINFFAKALLACSSDNFDTEILNYFYKKPKRADVFDLCNLVFENQLDKNCFLRQYYKDFSGDTAGQSFKFWK